MDNSSGLRRTIKDNGELGLQDTRDLPNTNSDKFDSLRSSGGVPVYGKELLVPTPTNDSLDPLNWSAAKKHAMLGVISIVAFLPDFGSSSGLPAFLPQAKYVKETLIPSQAVHEETNL